LVTDRGDVRRVDRDLHLAPGEVGAGEDVVDQLAAAVVDAAERRIRRGQKPSQVDEPPGIAFVRLGQVLVGRPVEDFASSPRPVSR
jgi:hypothetical protein